jgi:hypothetical protein
MSPFTTLTQPVLTKWDRPIDGIEWNCTTKFLKIARCQWRSSDIQPIGINANSGKHMISFIEKIEQASQFFSPGEQGLAVLVGFGTMLLLTLAHELGHLIPIRIFSSSGSLAFFPYRKDGGVKAWLAVAACDFPDDVAARLPTWKMAIVIAGGPVLDLLLTYLCVAYWSLFHGWFAVGVAYGGGIRLAISILNFLPIRHLRNDGSQFFILFGWLKEDSGPAKSPS